jgi:hypothetical protein
MSATYAVLVRNHSLSSVPNAIQAAFVRSQSVYYIKNYPVEPVAQNQDFWYVLFLE